MLTSCTVRLSAARYNVHQVFCCRYCTSDHAMHAIRELLEGCQTVVDREVDWGTMDAFKHVNNVQYNRWFEVVRVKHMTDLSIQAKELSYLSPVGVGPILKDVYTLFKGQVTYPDRVSIGIRTTGVDETSYTEEYKIVSHRTKRVVCYGTGTIVVLDYGTGKRAPIPSNLREILLKDKNGENWKE